MRKNLFSICIEGTKAAGKTTTIDFLKDCLEAKNVFVQVTQIFRIAKEYAVCKGFDGAFIMAQSAEGARELFEFMKAYQANERKVFLDNMSASPASFGCHIHDRGWITMRCHIEDSALPAIETDIQWDEWKSNLIPTYFIHTSPENTFDRKPDKIIASEGFSNYEALESDYERRMSLCKEYGNFICGKFETPGCSTHEIVKSILLDIDQHRQTR